MDSGNQEMSRWADGPGAVWGGMLMCGVVWIGVRFRVEGGGRGVRLVS